MSFPISGGAAASATIPAKNLTGAVVNVGDVLMLDLTSDGYEAVVPVLTAESRFLSPVGPAVGAPGATFLPGDALMIGVLGVFPTRVESTQNIAAQDVLNLVSAKKYLVTPATQPTRGLAEGFDALPAAFPTTPAGVANFNAAYTQAEINGLGDAVIALFRGNSDVIQAVAQEARITNDEGVIDAFWF